MSANPHGVGCNCHIHTPTECEWCPWTGMGTPQARRHVQVRHPEHWVPAAAKAIPQARRLAAKVLQAHQVAKEMNRMGERGVRFLPKGRLDKATVAMVNDWIKKMKDSAKVSDNLLIAGIDQSEKGISSIKEFNQIKASIKMSAQLGLNDKPGLWNRATHYNPTVAGEVLKLAFTLDKSFSFAVHLLLLYGLESLAEEISTTGPHPPTDIESPSKSIAQNQKQAVRVDVQGERDEAFYSRNGTFKQENRLEPYVVKADMEPKSYTDGQKH